MNQDLMVFFQEIIYVNTIPLKIKDGAHIINLDEYANVGTHWIALFCKKNEIVFFFDSFGSNIFLKKLKNLSKIKI